MAEPPIGHVLPVPVAAAVHAAEQLANSGHFVKSSCTFCTNMEVTVMMGHLHAVPQTQIWHDDSRNSGAYAKVN